MKKAISFIAVLLFISIISNTVYAKDDSNSNFIVSTDPIHPYIHEIIKNEQSSIEIFDENNIEVTEIVRNDIYEFYNSGNIDISFKILRWKKFEVP